MVFLEELDAARAGLAALEHDVAVDGAIVAGAQRDRAVAGPEGIIANDIAGTLGRDDFGITVAIHEQIVFHDAVGVLVIAGDADGAEGDGFGRAAGLVVKIIVIDLG